MASTPFTLAALATSAVPGLNVSGTRAHTSGSGGAFISAVLETDSGEVIVRVPTTAGAEVEQSGELLGQAALAEGARARLPFAVPTALGMTRAGDSRAVVSTFLPGAPPSGEQIAENSELLSRLAEAIAAIHELPAEVVRQGGLPARTAADVRTTASRVMLRAAQTGLLPTTVRQRWQEAVEADSLWSFEPVVVHGSLASERLLVDGDELLGVLGWNELSLGDPAIDLAWLLSSGKETFETALARYSATRELLGQREFVARARLHHELEVAKWLLHGVEQHDQAIIDDAVTMLDQLVDRLSLLGAALTQRTTLTGFEVERMLDETPEVPFDNRSETAEFEALDEDRAFDVEWEFQDAPPGRAARIDAPTGAAPRTGDTDEPETADEDESPDASRG